MLPAGIVIRFRGKRFDQKAFDLVIADVKLPGLRGRQLLDTIKNKSDYTPVIMMTGFGTVQNAVEAIKKGDFEYLLTPFSLSLMDQAAQEMVLGPKDVHQAMIAPEQANLAFRLMIQVRSKMIAAYEEIMRMQV
jgi:DNA-binding NtrC family response regulator